MTAIAPAGCQPIFCRPNAIILERTHTKESTNREANSSTQTGQAEAVQQQLRLTAFDVKENRWAKAHPTILSGIISERTHTKESTNREANSSTQTGQAEA